MKTLFDHFVMGALALSVWFPAAAQKAPPDASSKEGSASLSALTQSFSDRRPVFTQKGGENLYQAVCQGCHMAQGQGAKGAGFYPALTSNPKLAASAYPVAVVINGLHGMPGFGQRLTDEQVADVVNYVRTHFKNSYPDAVSATDVKAFR
jgi:mono/diheme cytochrome c family protein